MTFKKKEVIDEKETTEVQPIKTDRRKTMPHLQKKGAPSINPAGRPRGSRNKFADKFYKDFMEDWEKHGASAVKKARELDPVAYMRVAASLLPKELTIKQDENALDKLLEQFTIAELDQFIIGVTAVGIGAQGETRKNEKVIGGESTRVH